MEEFVKNNGEFIMGIELSFITHGIHLQLIEFDLKSKGEMRRRRD